jgi:hypothetical protein
MTPQAILSLATGVLVAATGVAHLFQGNVVMCLAYFAWAIGYCLLGFTL